MNFEYIEQRNNIIFLLFGIAIACMGGGMMVFSGNDYEMGWATTTFVIGLGIMIICYTLEKEFSQFLEEESEERHDLLAEEYQSWLDDQRTDKLTEDEIHSIWGRMKHQMSDCHGEICLCSLPKKKSKK